jgi:hypothetical protein
MPQPVDGTCALPLVLPRIAGAQQLHDITEHASQVQCAALCCRVSIPGDTEQSQSTTPGRGPARVMCRCDSVAFTTLRFIQLSHAAYSLDMPLL